MRNYLRVADALEQITGISYSPSTLWRWSNRLPEHRRLKIWKIGGQNYTTLEEVYSFIDRNSQIFVPTSDDAVQKKLTELLS